MRRKQIEATKELKNGLKRRTEALVLSRGPLYTEGSEECVQKIVALQGGWRDGSTVRCL